MSEAESIFALIGEFVYTEIDCVDRVEYAKEKNELTSFTIVMENGNRYALRTCLDEFVKV